MHAVRPHSYIAWTGPFAGKTAPTGTVQVGESVVILWVYPQDAREQSLESMV